MVINRTVDAKWSPFQSHDTISLIDVEVAAQVGDDIVVSLTFKNANGIQVGIPAGLYAFLSDSDENPAIVGTAPSGGNPVAAAGGYVHTVVAGKSFYVFADDGGDLTLTFTESGAKTAYLWFLLPNGKAALITPIIFA